MSSSIRLIVRPEVLLTLALAAGAFGLRALAEDAKPAPPPSQSTAPTTNAPPSAPKPPAQIAPRKLSGAELYSMHCNRCHPERYPTERTAAQWKTILMHMRVRANLPAEQARTILKFLQDNSGR